MLRSGDELGKTQHGNNNPYCQDNEVSWLQWDLDAEQQAFLEFCQQLTALWKSQPVLHRRRFFLGRRPLGSSVKDIAWLHFDGEEITDELWQSDSLRVLGMRLNGETLDDLDELGRPITGDTLLVLMNPTADRVSFRMPRHRLDDCWSPLLDTFENVQPGVELCVGDVWFSAPRSVTVFSLSHRRLPE
jgi:glycogen operon protein